MKNRGKLDDHPRRIQQKINSEKCQRTKGEFQKETRENYRNRGASENLLLGGRRLAPFLEDTHPLAPAIGAPQIAPAAGAVTAVFRPVVTVPTPSYAGSLLLGCSH